MPFALFMVGLVVAAGAFYFEPFLVSNRIGSLPANARRPRAASLIPLAGPFLDPVKPEPRAPDEQVPDSTRFSSTAVISAGAQVMLGVVFFGLGLQFRDDRSLILACVYSGILFEISLIDLRYRLVLNRLTYPAAALALLGSFLWPGIGPERALLGGGTALALFLVLEFFARGGLGRGDTKLAGLIGLMRGYPAIWTAALAGIMVGGLVAAALIVAGGRRRRDTFPYGPWLAIGAVISFFITGFP